MKPPIFPINTPFKVTLARMYLGYSKAELAREMRLGGSGRDSVRSWEDGVVQSIPGPVQIALERLVDLRASSKGPKP